MLECALYSLPLRIGRDDRVRHGGFGFSCATDAASPEKINALVVRDAKQPRSQRLRVIECLKLPVGVKKGVLNDVLAIENGADHP